jgi:YHS domain-containing protein
MFTRKTVKDPVCGMSVVPAKADAHVEHAGETYYFCSQHCADAFAADPAKYVVTTSEGR